MKKIIILFIVIFLGLLGYSYYKSNNKTIVKINQNNETSTYSGLKSYDSYPDSINTNQKSIEFVDVTCKGNNKTLINSREAMKIANSKCKGVLDGFFKCADLNVYIELKNTDYTKAACIINVETKEASVVDVSNGVNDVYGNVIIKKEIAEKKIIKEDEEVKIKKQIVKGIINTCLNGDVGQDAAEICIAKGCMYGATSIGGYIHGGILEKVGCDTNEAWGKFKKDNGLDIDPDVRKLSCSFYGNDAEKCISFSGCRHLGEEMGVDMCAPKQ